MSEPVLRTNATQIYAFLSLLRSRQTDDERNFCPRVLDCGAGGILPPLSLFAKQGFEAWGIDVSDKQLQLPQRYCTNRQIDVNLFQGDMQEIPFQDKNFDYVYEHYSICHLPHRATKEAIGEMHRVLRDGGLCQVGLISVDTWIEMYQEQEGYSEEEWQRAFTRRRELFRYVHVFFQLEKKH